MFSWTQSRIVLPAWLGLGTALAAARERHGLELLREMTATWPFFATLLSNAEMALRQGRPGDRPPLRASCGTTPTPRDRIWGIADRRVRADRSRSCWRSAAASACSTREPVLQASIDRRNPFVDPLSFVQIELLRRLRAGAGRSEHEELGRVSLLTINGIASGLRNTG